MGYWGYPEYVSVAKKKTKAAKKLKQLLKKNPNIKPVSVEGRTMARTWWGKSWNINLERYADYSNRIGRGRSYLRNRAVLDLQISGGQVTSLVQGSGSRPYSVVIKIKKIKNDIWKKIKSECEGKLDSLQELLVGKFPKALSEIFTAKGLGLFPTPKEIEFSCSCPDWASMCKHVAATLYGIGARLDEDPNLFFKLRNAEVGDLITQAVKSKTEKLLKKSKVKSKKVISESKISDIFGIDLEDEGRPSKQKVKTKKSSKATKTKTTVKATTSASPKSVKKAKKVVKKSAKKKVAKAVAKKIVKKTIKKKVAKVATKKTLKKATKKKVAKVVTKKSLKKTTKKKVAKVVTKKSLKKTTKKKVTKVVAKKRVK